MVGRRLVGGRGRRPGRIPSSHGHQMFRREALCLSLGAGVSGEHSTPRLTGSKWMLFPGLVVSKTRNMMSFVTALCPLLQAGERERQDYVEGVSHFPQPFLPLAVAGQHMVHFSDRQSDLGWTRKPQREQPSWARQRWTIPLPPSPPNRPSVTTTAYQSTCSENHLIMISPQNHSQPSPSWQFHTHIMR
jgi:hypothetical protein